MKKDWNHDHAAREASWAEAFDQLEQAQTIGGDESSTDAEMADLLTITRALDQLGQEDVAMPRALEFRRGVMSHVRQPRPWRSYLVGFAVAAIVLLAVFLPREPEPSGKTHLVMAPELIDQAMANQARSDMIDYLQSTELLLLSIRDYDFYCAENQLDMAPEKNLAKVLLLKQKMFHHQLDDPRYFQARQLFDQLERILVDVNNMDVCSDKFELEYLNQHIIKKRILTKLRVIAQEIQYS